MISANRIAAKNINELKEATEASGNLGGLLMNIQCGNGALFLVIR